MRSIVCCTAKLSARASRQEGRVDFGGAAFAAPGFDITVERATQDGITRKDAGDLVPALDVLPKGHVQHACHGRFVGLVRLDAAVVNGKFLEIGEDAERQARAPGVAPQLVGRVHVTLEVDRGLFGFDEELTHAADAKPVVGRLCATADLDGVLVHDVLVGLGVTLAVAHVPAQRVEERIDELAPDLGFVVGAAFVTVQVGIEAGDELVDDGGWRHR